MVEMCEKFGWTFEEYQNQPWWFLEIVKIKMNIEGDHLKKEEMKLKNRR